MKAQIYDDADYVRVFPFEQSFAMMDCYSDATAPIGKDVADVTLNRCGLRRRTKWKRYERMYEAEVRFKR